MSNLSSKDKARLALSAKRVERWEKLRIVWANQKDEDKNPRYKRGPKTGNLKRCEKIFFVAGQEKPSEIIKPCRLDWESW
jgi:hypothetical protein